MQASLASLNAGSALLARLNGSDFALLLPLRGAASMMIAERVRTDLHASRIPVGEAICAAGPRP